MQIDYEQLAEELADLPSELDAAQEKARAEQMSTLISKLLETLANPLAQPAPVVNVPQAPAAQVVVQPTKPVLDWTFDFIRNPDGTIKSIRAKAT